MESTVIDNRTLLDKIGMTAHIPRRVTVPRRDGTVYSRRDHWSTGRNNLNPSKLKTQFLSQRRAPTKASNASQDESLTLATVTPKETPESDSPPASELLDRQNRNESIAERKRKAITLLREMHEKEELRIAEVRNNSDNITHIPSQQPNLLPPSSTQHTNQHGASINTEEQESDYTTVIMPDQHSALLFEPSRLGPKTSNLYRKGSLLPVRQTSSASGYSTASAASTCMELDGNPISSFIELPAGEVLASCRPSYEYGDSRFNTLPGESYPLTEYRILTDLSTELPNVVTVTNDFFDVDEIEQQALRARIVPDADPRTGLPFRTPDP